MRRTVIFGELLFDLFPDGEAIGGAPFNVACHLQALGCEPLFLTRIGGDDRGQRALERLRKENFDLTGVQRDPENPTGTVQVSIESGQPGFRIPPAQAYDYLSAEECLKAVRGTRRPLLYCGTLALRSPASRQSLEEVLRATEAELLVDLNLRPPWWSGELLRELISKSRWLKVSQEEAEVLWPAETFRIEEVREWGPRLCREARLDRLAVTFGDRGAALAEPSGGTWGEAPAVEIRDTVGAGDAFTAILLWGILKGWTAGQVLSVALRFAAEVCQIRGAVPDRRDIYQEIPVT